MTLTSKPVWRRGMLMKPQHLQQLGRHIEAVARGRTGALHPAAWGIKELALDQKLLGIGKIAIEHCIVVFPDGEFVAVPDQAPPPPPRSVDPSTSEQSVFLGLPLQVGDGLEVSAAGEEAEMIRFRPHTLTLRDITRPNAEALPIEVALPNLKLLLESEPRDDFVTVPIARIGDVRDGIRLDETFIPPTLDVQATAPIKSILREIEMLLRSRADSIARRSGSARYFDGTEAMLELHMLQTLNRHRLLIAHDARLPGLHPETAYRDLLSLAGELSTFITPQRQPPDLPAYDHGRLSECFHAALEAIRVALIDVREQTAIPLPLQQSRYGIWLSPILDRTLLSDARFILLVAGEGHTESLRANAPSQIKIGPAEEIRNLVNLQLPGIPLTAIPIVPRELPYHPDAAYFELSKAHELWALMKGSAAFALHVGAGLPKLSLEFWAIREDSK
ncbi:type VI secretion system baseplate subunit TssK [Inquilinus limosus]|uniref:type VI secretion system baseplate subunit TssK n=1 Tax=Inquilinus limosus TaxID=171674 RepID=UPI003F1557F2